MYSMEVERQREIDEAAEKRRIEEQRQNRLKAQGRADVRVQCGTKLDENGPFSTP